MQSVGLEELAFTDVYDESRVQNGKKLVSIERSQRSRKVGKGPAYGYELNFKSSDDGDDHDESSFLI